MAISQWSLPIDFDDHQVLEVFSRLISNRHRCLFIELKWAGDLQMQRLVNLHPGEGEQP